MTLPDLDTPTGYAEAIMNGARTLQNNGNGSHPAAIMQGLIAHEDEMAEMVGDWANAEEKLIKLEAKLRRIELPIRQELKGMGTIPEIATEVEIRMWNNHEEAMMERVICEATIAACKVKWRIIDKSMSSKQSRLALEREMGKLPGNLNDLRAYR